MEWRVGMGKPHQGGYTGGHRRALSLARGGHGSVGAPQKGSNHVFCAAVQRARVCKCIPAPGPADLTAAFLLQFNPHSQSVTAFLDSKTKIKTS